MAKEEKKNLTGISDSQAQEIQKFTLMGFWVFTGIAVAAHVLTWMWRPWIPGPNGYSLLEAGQQVAQSFLG